MFATAHPARHASHGYANAYARVGVETGIPNASPHQLVLMLFEGFAEAVAQARGAMRSAAMEPKGRAIGRAMRIVHEGLRGGLNLRDGGELAVDLNDLYGYIVLRLGQANLHNDEAALDECLRLMQPLHQAWLAIAHPQT